MTQAVANNWLRMHESLTLTYAGAFQTRELTYYGGTYRQVLTSQGLTAFVNGSYGFGRPGTPELELLEYRTRSQYLETGLSYPVIRARERNLNVSGLWFWSQDAGSFFDMPYVPLSTLDKMRGFRLGPTRRRRPVRLASTEPTSCSARASRHGQHGEQQRARLARLRPGRFHQDGINRRGCSRCSRASRS